MRPKSILTLAVIGVTLVCQTKAETNDIIDLKLRPVNFTNLQGRAYLGVRLIRADLDGITYRVPSIEGSGYFVSYTNLPQSLLENWDIPTNRIAFATERALQRAEQDKARRIQAAKAYEDRLKAIKKIAFDKGYRAGSMRGARAEADGDSRPNKEQLESIARMDGYDFWVSPITGRATVRKAHCDLQEKSTQADYLEGFKAGYADGFKKSAKPAF